MRRETAPKITAMCLNSSMIWVISYRWNREIIVERKYMVQKSSIQRPSSNSLSIYKSIFRKPYSVSRVFSKLYYLYRITSRIIIVCISPNRQTIAVTNSNHREYYSTVWHRTECMIKWLLWKIMWNIDQNGWIQTNPSV